MSHATTRIDWMKSKIIYLKFSYKFSSKLINAWFWTRMLQINSVKMSLYNTKLINLCPGVSEIF